MNPQNETVLKSTLHNILQQVLYIINAKVYSLTLTILWTERCWSIFCKHKLWFGRDLKIISLAEKQKLL